MVGHMQGDLLPRSQ